MYRVKVYFTDLQDNGKPYYPGEIYPRAGLTVSEERLKELRGPDNKRRMPLIEYIPEREKPVKELEAQEPEVPETDEEKPQGGRRKAK